MKKAPTLSKISSVAVGLIFAAIFASTARSQSTTEVRGRVEDETHRPLTSAFVMITERDTSLMRAATTDLSGEFVFPSLPVGIYAIKVSAEGFASFESPELRASIGAVVGFQITLGRRESRGSGASLDASRSLVETGNAQLGVVMSEPEVNELPLRSRDAFDLLQLQPGVQSTIGTNLFFGSDRPGVVSVSGARIRSNNYEVNGGYSADQMVNSPSIEPSPDTISEFRVISHDYEASYGRNSGSILDVVTKSGGGRFHGSLYEFFRNTTLNSKGYFDVIVPEFKQNEFGATVGGPIRTSRTFYFASYEGHRERQGITSTPVPVPTAAEREGDFSAGPAFAGTLSDGKLAQALSTRPGCSEGIAKNGGATITAHTSYAAIFPGNIIPSACFDATAFDLMAQFVPLANSANDIFIATPKAMIRKDQGTFRLDHNLTGQQQLTFYYYGNDTSDAEPFSYFLGQGATLPGFGTTTNTRYQQLNLSHHWTVTAKTINDLRLVYYREGEGSLLSPSRTNLVQDSCKQVPASQCFSDPVNPDLGIHPGYTAQNEGVPFISLSGGFAYGNNPNGNFSQTGNVYQLQESYIRIFGRHTTEFGGDFSDRRLHQGYFYDINGAYQFLGNGPNDVGFSDLVPNYLLGLPDNFSEGSANAVDARSNELDLFAQDSWKVQQNLMLNYGLRWELNTPYVDGRNRIQTFRPGQATTLYPCVLNASDPIAALTHSTDCSPDGPARSVFPLGLVVPGDAEVPGGLTNDYERAFAPRFGLAWSPSWRNGLLSRVSGEPGHMSVRLGWGIFYDTVEELMFGENLVAQPPFGGSTILSNVFFNTPFLGQNGSIAPNPFRGFQDPQPGTAVDFAQFRPITLYGNLPSRFRTPYAEQYHVTIQRDLRARALLQLAYVGSQGHRLTATLDQNYGQAQPCLDLNQIPGMSCGPYGADNAYSIPAGTIPPGVTVHLPYGSVASITGPNAAPITLVGLRHYSSPFCEPTTGAGCPPDGIPVFASLFSNQPIASSSYNSLQALANRKLVHGLQFLAAYTWSKSIDDASSFENSINPIDPRRSRSLSLFDARSRLILSNYWQIPLSVTKAWTHILLGGWAIAGIFTVQSGFPIRMTSSSDEELMNSFDFESVGEPEQTGPFRRLSPQHSGGYFFDPSSFTDATLGQIGNTPRTLCCGPGVSNFDLGIHKTIPLTEGMKISFRAEFFNALNHTQFYNPDGNITDGGSFGQVSQARNPRLVQLALRLTF